MAKYWNAVDVAIHVPLSTRNWVETFSLAVVQAMAVGLPIIGSDSGSVPYQIGFEELIVHEGDSKELANKMEWLMKDDEIRKKYARLVHDRTMEMFEINVLNDEMHDICESL
jgi:glycosyltransferase involved in cell wall biosynthesis